MKVPPTPVYLDYNATSPVLPEVLEAMLPWLRGGFGNPSSTHALGREAKSAVQRAREQLAQAIGADPQEITFTSGGTESNNTALLGIEAAHPGERCIVIGAAEHPSVEAPARVLAARGWTLRRLPFGRDGRVSLTAVREGVLDRADLVSVILAHNETGAVQPVAAVVVAVREICGDRAMVHTDGAQAVGKIPVDVRALGVDLLTIAGHKFGAPKGVGALYRRRGVELPSILHGGGQESGLRPGTENVAAIVGLGEAARVATLELASGQAHCRALRERLWSSLRSGIPGIRRTIETGPVLPNTLHVLLPTPRAAELLAACPTVLASTGSACHAARPESESEVVRAMGLDAELGAAALRLSVGRATSEDEVDQASRALELAWRTLPGDAA